MHAHRKSVTWDRYQRFSLWLKIMKEEEEEKNTSKEQQKKTTQKKRDRMQCECEI